MIARALERLEHTLGMPACFMAEPKAFQGLPPPELTWHNWHWVTFDVEVGKALLKALRHAGNACAGGAHMDANSAARTMTVPYVSVDNFHNRKFLTTDFLL
ncbi:MAG: hypothetical protein A3H27_10650 [Acidobacteria bacterium RIFCSPLOWO2_02_FULL_59_13]|nr:MAG: hypothetical protein A3H27_10650 [Acidobacteria bacterium RIFCSPLOWO2_02_FULL_59_13]